MSTAEEYFKNTIIKEYGIYLDFKITANNINSVRVSVNGGDYVLMSSDYKLSPKVPTLVLTYLEHENKVSYV